MVDRYKWQIQSSELADFTGPKSGSVDDPGRLQALSVGRVNCPAAGLGLCQRRDGCTLPDDGAVQPRADRQRLRQRVRVDVPISWVVQTCFDVVHVQ